MSQATPDGGDVPQSPPRACAGSTMLPPEPCQRDGEGGTHDPGKDAKIQVSGIHATRVEQLAEEAAVQHACHQPRLRRMRRVSAQCRTDRPGAREQEPAHALVVQSGGGRPSRAHAAQALAQHQGQREQRCNGAQDGHSSSHSRHAGHVTSRRPCKAVEGPRIRVCIHRVRSTRPEVRTPSPTPGARPAHRKRSPGCRVRRRAGW